MKEHHTRLQRTGLYATVQGCAGVRGLEGVADAVCEGGQTRTFRFWQREGRANLRRLQTAVQPSGNLPRSGQKSGQIMHPAGYCPAASVVTTVGCVDSSTAGEPAKKAAIMAV